LYPTQETIEADFPSPIKWRGVEGRASCPFHDDEHPSFSVNRETGLWICHAGCGKRDFRALVSKLGALPPQAFFDANSSPKSIPAIKSRKHDFEYVYRDENNHPVFLIGKDVSVTGKHFQTYHYAD
jgi:putative DNA primase/helicase